MPELPIEDIHRLLDMLDYIRRKPQFAGQVDGNRVVDISTLGDLCLVVLEVLGWTNTAYMQNDLGIAPSVLSKFVKMRGTIRTHDVRAVVERLRTFLRSQDQASSVLHPSKSNTQPPGRPLRATHAIKILRINGEQWIALGDNSQTKAKIGAVAVLLDSILEQTKHTNVPSEEQALSELEKQQLITILETTLNVLRSPLVEKGLLRTAQKVLKKGAERAAENGVQVGLGFLMGAAAARFDELLHLITG